MSTETPQPMVEFLVHEFAEAMEAQNAQGQDPPFDIPAMLNSLGSFRQFVKDYLATNPIHQLHTNMSGTYGVELTNRKQCLVGLPLDELKGSMQPSTHQAVTGQQTANDMQQAAAIPMTGQSNLIPPNAVDFAAPQAAQNMTQSQPQVRYDQQHPAVS